MVAGEVEIVLVGVAGADDACLEEVLAWRAVWRGGGVRGIGVAGDDERSGECWCYHGVKEGEEGEELHCG